MDWLLTLQKAIDFMEIHLCENITADDVAKECAISSFYLQKGFSIITGYSIGEYIRNRRLYEAALELQSANEKIINTAFKYCYETPESFTKAFSRFHGCTPMEVRNKLRNIKIFIPLKIQISIQGGNKMNYRIEKMTNFKIIGFKRKFNMETSLSEIPKFWDEVFGSYAKKLYSQHKLPENATERAFVENQIGMYGACIDDETETQGDFNYMIAGPYCGGAVPEGLEIFEFEASEWAKFDCVMKTIQETTQKIFSEWLPTNKDFEMTSGSSIEWYSSDDEPFDQNHKCSVWIPVKRK